MRSLSAYVVISEGGKQTNGRPRDRGCDQRQAEVFGMFGLGQHISSTTDTQKFSLLHQAADFLGMDREPRKVPGLENRLRTGRSGQPVTLSGIQRHVINYTHFYTSTYTYSRSTLNAKGSFRGQWAPPLPMQMRHGWISGAADSRQKLAAPDTVSGPDPKAARLKVKVPGVLAAPASTALLARAC
jgi:hypothetical protein